MYSTSKVWVQFRLDSTSIVIKQIIGNDDQYCGPQVTCWSSTSGYKISRGEIPKGIWLIFIVFS